jgi:hypothetical protein
VRGPQDAFFDTKLWRVNKLLLAQALVAPSTKQRLTLLEQYAAEAVAKSSIQRTLKPQHESENANAIISKKQASILVGLVEWVEAARKQPQWKACLAPLMQRVVEAQPQPVPHLQRLVRVMLTADTPHIPQPVAMCVESACGNV